MESPEFEELKLMLDDMERVDPLYRPTQFWSVASREIIADLEARGFREFKNHDSAQKYYVPAYVKKGERLLAQKVRRLLEITRRLDSTRLDQRSSS
jgi:hypothetical protein